jgi:penicillin-binding protein 1A
MRTTFFTIALTVLSGSLRVFKLILSLLAGIILFSTVAFVAIYFYFARGLPDIRSIEDYNPPIISQVFADDGTVVGEFWTECRIFLPYEKIPKKIIGAFVASEDARFFEHKGVDMRSIIRAFIANLKAGEITQGGSTITQQITRSLLLTPERTVTRKIKEAILATRIERALNKEQILTLYLNQIFLGNRSYGIAAAARNYFHKTVDEMNLSEIALIAGMPSAPSLFSPINNPDEAKIRQRHVLNRMLDENLITEEEMQSALNQRLKIYVAGTDKDFAPAEAKYFVEYVRKLIKDKYGDDVLYGKGLKIYTTLDIEKQRAAYRALRDGVEKITRRQGWTGPIDHVAVTDMYTRAEKIKDEILKQQQGGEISWPPEKTAAPPETILFDKDKYYDAIVTGFRGKDTLVIVGNFQGIVPYNRLKWARPFASNRYNYDDGTFVSDPKNILKIGDVINVKYVEGNEFSLYQYPKVQGAIFSLNPHTGGVVAMIGGYDFSKSEFNRAVQALRQPGSSIKPYVYAAALDKGYTYNTIINDEPVQYVVGRHKVWSPKNYGGGHKGPTPFINCIKFSRNVPTVKILADIGPHYVTAYQRKMGITTPIDKYLSMALGANVVTLAEMVAAYTTFLNNGLYREPFYITKIVDSKGNVLEEKKLNEIKGETEDKITELRRPRDPKEVELNIELFEKNKQWIEKDGLVLSEPEIKTLYGNSIPEGHVITPQTAYLMVRLLREVVTGGTGTRVNALGKPVAGKTGTTNDETDTWFIGFVPDLSAGVWIGFDEIEPIGRGETGGRTSAPIFLEYMKEATKDFEPKDFTPPPGFPVGQIASLPGGSAVLGTRFAIEEAARTLDRAGAFFEEDMESYSREEQLPDSSYRDSYPKGYTGIKEKDVDEMTETPGGKAESFDSFGF